MPIRTIARLYDSYETAAETVQELERAGIPSNQISVVANNTGDRAVTKMKHGNDAVPGAEIGAGLGAVGGGAAGVLTGLGLLAISGVGPVVAAGLLVALAVGAVGGAAAGGLLGGLLGAGISDDHAEVYTEGVRRGGTLVTTRVTEDTATAAEAIFDRHAVDPAVRREQYAASGWSAYDPNGPLLSDADIERQADQPAADFGNKSHHPHPDTAPAVSGCGVFASIFVLFILSILFTYRKIDGSYPAI